MEKEVRDMFFSGKYVVVLFFLIAVLHILATVNLWYWVFPWFDIPMHFLGGFWTAMVFVYFDRKFGFSVLEGKGFFVSLLLIVSFAALIGVLWEFFEFSYSFLIKFKNSSSIAQRGMADTLGDLFFDLIGGSVLAFITKFFYSNPESR